MKIGIITGASSGMGKEFVKIALEENLDLDEIWVIARRKERLEIWQKHYKEQTFRVLPLDLQKKEEFEILKKELEEATNKAMVVQAEMINFRRRKEEETASMLKYANQDLILEVISVLDNFERALNLDDNNLNDELSKFLVGFKMIYASLSEILKKYGVEEIKAYEKEFDPSMHQAMMVDKDENKPNNIVLDVLLKGYKLKDRVIRPAAVKVNKLDD